MVMGFWNPVVKFRKNMDGTYKTPVTTESHEGVSYGRIMILSNETSA